MTPCPSRRRDLQDLVDGALGPRDQEKLGAHLVTCRGCRAEAESLRQVRNRVRLGGAASPASPELTLRLVSIAGEAAHQPLYARPFDRSATGVLPSRRRRTRHAAAGAMTLTCLVLACLVGAGWAAAPPTRTPALDPGPVVVEEFAAVLGESPLANLAVTAVRAAEASEQKTGELAAPPESSTPLTSTGAEELLNRAAWAGVHTPHEGTQVVQVRHLAGYWVTDVQVRSWPGQGTQVTFPDRRGADRSVFMPPREPAESVAVRHDLLAGAGPVVAGRRTILVEARAYGRPAGRWWLDDETGLMLWQQTFDETGTVTLSAGYRSLTVGPVAEPRHLPPRLGPRGTTANLALAGMGGLESQGWQCSDARAGLALVRARGDEGTPMLHQVYSDGIVTLSVFQHRGALATAPSGFVWDPRMRAYRSLGLTTMYSWQSGDTVFTVATDGPAALAERAVSELPHHSPVLRTRTDRVVDGWRHLLGRDR